MIEVVILAIALSMDAFAVSIGLGSKRQEKTRTLAAWSAFYFGFFQALMPLVGFSGGRGVYVWIESHVHWISFMLLLLIGFKMLYEAFSENIEDDISQITHKVMLMLAIATSIDAMASGFTLMFLEVNPFISCLIIGITTAIFSWSGVYVGRRSGTRLESKAELLGGIILILIGFKILIA